jgi:hypothetical protein
MEENKNDSNEEVISLKSIDEKDNNDNIIDIIEKSNKNRISLTSTKTHIKIDIKSLKKIFSYFTEKDQLSDMYLDHITILFDFNPNKKKESRKSETINNTNDEIIELDVKYKTILEKATIFHINLEKTFDNENEDKDKKNTNIRTSLRRQSLKKIFTYLNESIISMSDYINLVILYLKNENQNDLAKMVIEQKILGKYNKKKQSISFNGKKDFNCIMNRPLKNISQNIYTLDILFNKVLDYIDDYDKESSFSDNINNLIIPRKNIDEDLIQTTKVCFVEEGILTDLDSNNIIKKKDEIKHINNNQQICGNATCNDVCYIF